MCRSNRVVLTLTASLIFAGPACAALVIQLQAQPRYTADAFELHRLFVDSSINNPNQPALSGTFIATNFAEGDYFGTGRLQGSAVGRQLAGFGVPLVSRERSYTTLTELVSGNSTIFARASQGAHSVGVRTESSISGDVKTTGPHGNIGGHVGAYATAGFFETVTLVDAPPLTTGVLIYEFQVDGELTGALDDDFSSAFGAIEIGAYNLAGEGMTGFVDFNGREGGNIPFNAATTNPRQTHFTSSFELRDPFFFESGLSQMWFGIQARADARVQWNNTTADVPAFVSSNGIANSQNTMKLSAILVELEDGTRVTPESLGIDLAFDSGLPSPNAIPEPTPLMYFALLGLASLGRYIWRRR